jgi:hypothetical protein
MKDPAWATNMLYRHPSEPCIENFQSFRSGQVIGASLWDSRDVADAIPISAAEKGLRIHWGYDDVCVETQEPTSNGFDNAGKGQHTARLYLLCVGAGGSTKPGAA